MKEPEEDVFFVCFGVCECLIFFCFLNDESSIAAVIFPPGEGEAGQKMVKKLNVLNLTFISLKLFIILRFEF